MQSKCALSVAKAISSKLGEKQKQSLGPRVLLASDLINGAGKEAEAESRCVHSVGKRSRQRSWERSRSKVSVCASCWQAISSELAREKQKQSLSVRVLFYSHSTSAARIKISSRMRVERE